MCAIVLAFAAALGADGPAAVTPAADGSLRLTAAAGRGVGPSVKFMPRHAAFGWFTAADRVEWAVAVARPGTYDVRLEWSVGDKSAGRPFVFTVGGREVAGTVAKTGSWETYKAAVIGRVTLPAGRHTAAFRAAGPFDGPLLDLREVRLTPVAE